MSDLEKAARAAVEAADNTELVRTIAAVLATQQMAQQPTAPVPAPLTDRRPVGLYVAAGIGGAVALTALAMAAALLAVAVAVGAVCATVCLLVLKSLLDDYQRRR
ncbi:hypothetical protein [Streptomyces europaeiscabiei]|uniref:hypothetical protein n=1 Tax=Streptomyces europaeiscabiei TaxID=146819 RepID=UPI0029AD1066|nr:hypothetical protein [Streptomyces europaeiscabiei]MDX3582001.1 hypothetical protein [Streptomyces europaeiscabiei]